MKAFNKAWNFFWDWLFWPVWTIWVVVGSLTGIMSTTFGLVILGLAVVFFFVLSKFQENLTNKYQEMVKNLNRRF